MDRGLRLDLRTIFGCLSRARRGELAMLIVLMPATAIAEALTVASIVPFVALLSGQPLSPPLGQWLETLVRFSIARPLILAALLFALIVIFTAVLRLGLSWISRHFAFAFGHELSVDIQRRLLGQNYAYHLQHHSSEHLAALDKVDLLVFDLVIQGVQAISALLIGACIFALLVAIDPLNTAIAFLVIGGFYAVALAGTRRRLQRHGAVINTAYEQRAKFVQESVGGIRDLILDHAQEAALDRFRAVDADFARARTRTAFLAAAPRFLIEAAGLMVIALLAIAIAGRSGGITPALPYLGALALGSLRMLPLMGQLYGAWANTAIVGPIMSDVARLLRLPLNEEDGATRTVEFHQSIELKGVGFNYPGRAYEAVEDVTLTIPRGARVAITGRTGSGKSTLADLLMGLIEPSRGEILIDGLRLSADRLPGWRRLIAHVPQEIFLADDSIAANIALSFQGGEVDLDRVSRAAQSVQLRQFVETLPGGFATKVGERGVRLSGGQRQRLALARALYKGTPVLVLDEPTSSLDAQTETAIINALDKLQSEGTTIIIVAHRLTTMAKCDPVFILDEGRLARSRGHLDLFGKPKAKDEAG